MMNTSGDVAEQIVHLSLAGTEVALKLTGSAAKNIAAMLYAVLTDKKQSKGKARIETMLRANRPMTAYTVSRQDCKEFQRQAKNYGIMYCPIPYKKQDDTVDLLVFTNDAPRIDRIVNKFCMAAVAESKQQIDSNKTKKMDIPATPEKEKPDKSADDHLLDDLMDVPIQKEGNTILNPETAKMEKSHPSEPISEKPSKTAEGTVKLSKGRPSVREELRAIRENMQKEAAEPSVSEPTAAKKPKKQQTTTHKQLSTKRTKKLKER